MNALHNYAPVITGRGNSTIWKAASLLLVSELILTQLAVSSPQLHHWLHGGDSEADSYDHHCGSHEDSENAQEADHVCAITLMAAGISSEEGALEFHPARELDEPIPPASPRLAEKPAMARHLARGPPHRF